MAKTVPFEGQTHDFGPPVDRKDSVGRLSCFLNGVVVVSAWELSDAEIADIIKTKRVFLSVMSGTQVFPVFVGSEREVAAAVADTGRIWR